MRKTLLLAALFAAHAASAKESVSDRLLRYTEEFSRAGQAGDRAVLAKYLDDDVQFVVGNGEQVTKQEILDSTSPPADGVVPKIITTEWKLVEHGPVAVATFIDVVERDFHGQMLTYRYKSTETWMKKKGDWKMIGSETLDVLKDPPSVALSPAKLDDYVGTYRAAPDFAVIVSRGGDGLKASVGGAEPVDMKAEFADVFFVPGQPLTRRIFLRDAGGKITGLVSRRDGTDAMFKKDS